MSRVREVSSCARLGAMMQGLMDFIFPRRLGRLNYWVRSYSLVGLLYAMNDQFSTLPHPLPLSWLVAGLGLVIYAFGFLILPRMRDCGMRAWTLLLIFIPGFQYVLSPILTFRRSWTPLDAWLSVPHEEPVVEPPPSPA